MRVAKKNETKEKVLDQGALRDALKRVKVYRNAGADVIMIHSKSTLPDDSLSFLIEHRSKDSVTPLVVVPATYFETTETPCTIPTRILSFTPII